MGGLAARLGAVFIAPPWNWSPSSEPPWERFYRARIKPDNAAVKVLAVYRLVFSAFGMVAIAWFRPARILPTLIPSGLAL